MRAPSSRRASGNRATAWKCLSRVGWALGEASAVPLSPTSLDECPRPGAGHGDSGTQEKLGINPAEPLAPEGPGGSGWPAQEKCSVH